MGPLHGVRVVEMAGLAPVPFCGMILADLGAEVIRIDRMGGGYAAPPGPTDRGKGSVAVDLKKPAGRTLVRDLAGSADVFVEGYRPGVAERLGIGPAELHAANPRLVYGRLTGWGQDGPLAPRAGHDINFIALSGALEIIGRPDQRPVPPANIVGDFAGGGMLLAMGVMSALYEREKSGHGQVIDAAMVDGSSLLLTFLHGLHHNGLWSERRGTNVLDGAAAYYDTYETADGRFIAVGAVEPEFFSQLVAVLGIDADGLDFQLNPLSWPHWRKSSLADNRVTALIVVPIMLRRLIDHEPNLPERQNLSALRIIFVAGSQLGASLCTRAMDAFGPIIYNLYGSTEVAYATIATPHDLAVEPGCVGSVVRGAVVKILDDTGNDLPTGATGGIFVANSVQFEGYTGGGTKQSIGDLMSSGDVGHFDTAGRLFIDGRDDDMIVSGGENAFPAEVEETLARHPEIVEAAVVGVPDDDYGQRLRCFIVVRDGAVLTEQQVKDFVKHSLARFKVPRDVRFVNALPRNATGKVLKRVLNPDSAVP